jgi:flagellar basal body-associated protein FliL
MTEEAPKVVEKEAEIQAPKKKKTVFVVGGIILGIVVICGAVLGYGFFNGSQIRNYGVFAEKTYVVTKDWDNAFDEADLTTVKENIGTIKLESDAAIAALNGKSAPSKAKKLKADLVEYFTLSKKVATESEGIIEWAAEIEKVGTGTSALTGLDVSTPEGMAASIDKAKADVDASLVRLEALTVPESMKTQNDSFKKMLKDLSDMYGKLSVALKANDMTALTTITSEFATVTSGLSEIKDPQESLNEAYKTETDRIDQLDKSINTAIIDLKNVGFSF